MRRRVLLPLVTLAATAGLALAGAAAIDHGESSATTRPGFGAGPVQPGTPRTDGWAAVVDFDARIDPGSRNACERGGPACLSSVVDEMAARLELQGCTHTAPFAFTYLEMTRGVERAVGEPAFFDDPPSTVHADALFARLYFDAFDNWAAGRLDEVPGVWRIAFETAARADTNAATDLLLGMNAHISRDLPYVVADVAAWQGSGGRGDFERVNQVIARVKRPMLREAAERFDPSLALLDLPLPALAASDSAELIATWRNQALDRGLRLARADSGPERAAIEGEIERSALATAVLLLNAGTVTQGPVPPAARDAYCEAATAQPGP